MRIARTLAFLSLPIALAACTPEDASRMMENNASAAASVIVIDLEAGSGDTMMAKDESSASSAGAMMGKGESSHDAMDKMEKHESSRAASVTAASAARSSVVPVAQAAAGTYAAFNRAFLADGQTKVLFFHAAWCPICRAQETELLDWYTRNAQTFLTTYKVDYDAEKDLKAKYGVTYQHTFVKVDGQGNLVTKIQGPTDEQLTALLTR